MIHTNMFGVNYPVRPVILIVAEHKQAKCLNAMILSSSSELKSWE
ncbi:hypothetical protein ATI45_3856 [Marinobacter sp. LV10MA510-1]|nr:hypothetical protein ATI45_3856 [Marinobacter sp. LV10MA510-1]PFG53181.1 hypothetical protein ATG98_2264 [Marinobacter sp. LV10R520-4]